MSLAVYILYCQYCMCVILYKLLRFKWGRHIFWIVGVHTDYSGLDWPFVYYTKLQTMNINCSWYVNLIFDLYCVKFFFSFFVSFISMQLSRHARPSPYRSSFAMKSNRNLLLIIKIYIFTENKYAIRLSCWNLHRSYIFSRKEMLLSLNGM